jgi:hypothetical protein
MAKRKCPGCGAVKACGFCKSPRNRLRSLKKARKNRKLTTGLMRMGLRAAKKGSPGKKITD